MSSELERQAINVIRGLAMDAPHAANNGHPGTAMALAPLAHVLWTRVMRYDPTMPEWPDRDRFILSAGHASIMQYSMLYLSGYGLTLDDIRAFRTWGSATPGHPEVGHTAGVEVTTGPLGQGFANGVGMAMAERRLRTRYGSDVCDHHVFAVCSDGDLFEGISHEAASFAGHQKLGRMVYVYDDNHISIDGPTELSLTDDAVRRFEAYGWHVDDIGDAAEDLDEIEAALRRGMAETERPTLIVLRSHIGYPSPAYTDTAKAHGSPFASDEIARTKEVMGLPADESFWVPDDVVSWYRTVCGRGKATRLEWEARMEAFAGDREAYLASLDATGLTGWSKSLPTWAPGESVATRVAGKACLDALADVVPGLVSGGADLTENTGVQMTGVDIMSAEKPDGRLVHWGVREHAMAAAMTGMALHGGVLPVGGTFLIFSDYARPSIRIAALSKAKVIYSFSHDSVGLGQDGPTHQPIEQLMTLRAIPDLRVVRPADANETAGAYQVAVRREGPTVLALSRQNLPVLAGSAEAVADGRFAKGAYVLVDAPVDDCDLVLVGTGSEVSVCVEAAKALADDEIVARVVSMPCWELFDEQTEAYQRDVLPEHLPVLAVEAGVSLGWDRWADDVVAIDRFGTSAPGDVVLDRFGFNAGNVAERAVELLDSLDAATLGDD